MRPGSFSPPPAAVVAARPGMKSWPWIVQPSSLLKITCLGTTIPPSGQAPASATACALQAARGHGLGGLARGAPPLSPPACFPRPGGRRRQRRDRVEAIAPTAPVLRVEDHAVVGGEVERLCDERRQRAGELPAALPHRPPEPGRRVRHPDAPGRRPHRDERQLVLAPGLADEGDLAAVRRPARD